MEFFSQPSQPSNAASQPLDVGVNRRGGEIFLTQGLNLGLLHCRWILYCLSHQGSIYMCMYIYIYIYEKEVAAYSSILAWKNTPWTEEPGGL